MKLYLIVEVGYEGIDELIFPTENPEEALNKVYEIRAEIISLDKRRIEVLEAAGKDENGDYKTDGMFSDAWDVMGLPKKDKTRELTSREWRLGKYGMQNLASYCIRKWDGENFKCCCEELKLKPIEDEKHA